MVSKINADTSNGLILESDTSGTVDIQSGGTTVAQVTSSSIVGKQDIILDAGKNFVLMLPMMFILVEQLLIE